MEAPVSGMTSSDDFETGTRAAAFGGTTCINDFATPAAVYADICAGLSHANLIRSDSQVIMEKPIGDSLKAACPDGIDVYFDNVGGEILETALSQLKMHGRVACCGVVSAYDTAAQQTHGPRGVPFLFVVKRLTMRGFIVSDFFGRRDEALAQLRSWVEAGRLKVIEDIVEGFDNLPDALIGLLHGDNRGKRMVRIG